jgi:hypothetical protein
MASLARSSRPAAPPARFVLCRPQGGLNDLLCQVEVCRRYAARYGRTLVIDTQGTAESCLPLPFCEVFSWQPDEPAEPKAKEAPRTLDAALLAEMSRPGVSVSPPALTSNLHRRVSRWAVRCRVPDGPSAASVVVHIDSGGGDASHALIAERRLTLAPAYRAAAQRWAAICGPEPYVAVHVRHTDCKTPDYARRLQAIFRLEQGPDANPILVCSDSAEVMATARRLAGEVPGARLIENDTMRLVTGAPIHLAAAHMASDAARTYIEQTLRDLFLLSGARTLHLMAPAGRRGPAGFSRLARFLQSDPAARDFFFGL